MTNKEVQNITLESLRDWFKKEKWVRISSSGNIAGDCGTSKNKKNPDRCLPKAKAQSLTKGQRAATAAKKKKAGSKGKTVVKNTKKATVKKEAYKPGSIAPKDLFYSDKHGKLVAMDDVDSKYHDRLELVYKKGDKIEDPMDEGLWANINAKKKAGKKPSHGNSNAHKSAEKAGKALGKEEYTGQHQGSNYKWPMSQATKDRKEADKKVTKEDIRNLVAGTIAEMQQNENLLQEDDRCTRLAKSKYDTWPSAYASGAVVRCRRGEIWKKK